MCLIAFAIGASTRWPVVIASNRDEFFDRPTLPLARWASTSGQTILSGRDLRGGGTWIGATPGGRIALLTNVRELGLPLLAARSRGELVMRWLEGDMDAAGFMATTDSSAYGGFNLVLGDVRAGHWTWLANRLFDRSPHNRWPDRPSTVPAGAWQSQPLANGIYSISNASLDTPWPKALELKKTLESALQASDENALAAPLWTALANRRQASLEELPDTGLPVDLESALSSACISEPGRGSKGYGTRCSTLLVVNAGCQAVAPAWLVSMTERTFAPPGQKPEQVSKNPVTIGCVRINDTWPYA